MPCGWYFISDSFAVTLHPDTLAILPIVNLKGKSMVVTNKTEQGRQYKEYTREATGNKAERSAQLLGGEFLDEPSGKAERFSISNSSNS